MPDYNEKANILTLRVSVGDDSKIAFLDWEAKLNNIISSYPGFVSLEVLYPTTGVDYWQIVQRFNDSASAVDWSLSSQHDELIQELKAIANDPNLKEIVTGESSFQDGVTEVFITRVVKGKEEAFREWRARIHHMEARWPGFRGAYVQSPSVGSGNTWITLIQFDTAKNLEKWLNAPERKALIEETKLFVDNFESHRVISPYSGWFASIAKAGELPALWKQTMLVLLVLFPIVMLELKFLNPYLKSLDVSLSTFIGNAISVSLISWPMMPLAIFALSWWLVPKERNRNSMTILGTLVVLGLYLIEILIFWRFL